MDTSSASVEATADDLLTPAEVAAILFVDPKTVTRWARAGKLESIRTPGGHRRYQRADVLAIMRGHHHSQQANPAVAAPTATTRPSYAVASRDVQSTATATEAIARALEAEAEAAVQAVARSAAEVARAAEQAAVAAARARGARADADRAAVEAAEHAERETASSVQIPVQRQHHAGNL